MLRQKLLIMLKNVNAVSRSLTREDMKKIKGGMTVACEKCRCRTGSCKYYAKGQGEL
jgi:hypothetical protein